MNTNQHSHLNKTHKQNKEQNNEYVVITAHKKTNNISCSKNSEYKPAPAPPTLAPEQSTQTKQGTQQGIFSSQHEKKQGKNSKNTGNGSKREKRKKRTSFLLLPSGKIFSCFRILFKPLDKRTIILGTRNEQEHFQRESLEPR